MNNYLTLFLFEIKKIFKQKIVLISLAIVFILEIIILVSPLIGTYYLDNKEIETNYNMFLKEREYEEKLDGKMIDQALLETMKVGYEKIPNTSQHYITTEEYQTYARPYSAIFNFVRQQTGMTTSETIKWVADEQDLYLKRQAMLRKSWDSYFLSQQEKDFWSEQENKIEFPVEYKYKEGYWNLFISLNTIALAMIVVVSICLSNIFTQEHIRKTDQLILSSKNGRKESYWAKFCAGAFFSLVTSVICATVAFAVAFILYGTEGFSSAFILMFSEYSYPLSTGVAVIIMYLMMIFATVITGIFVMVVSEIIHSNIGTLSIVVGIVILTLFVSVPPQYRVVAQLWSYIPSEFVGIWNIFNPWTTSIFGFNLVSWQVAPIVYLIFGIMLAFIGKLAYVRYQVKGR